MTNNKNNNGNSKCRVPGHQCRSDRQQCGPRQRQRHQRYQSNGKASINNNKNNNNSAIVGAIKTWTTAQRNNKDIKLLKSNRRVDVGGDRQATNEYYLHTYTHVHTDKQLQVQSGKLSRKGSQGSHVVTLPYSKKRNQIRINKLAKQNSMVECLCYFCCCCVFVSMTLKASRKKHVCRWQQLRPPHEKMSYLNSFMWARFSRSWT